MKYLPLFMVGAALCVTPVAASMSYDVETEAVSQDEYPVDEPDLLQMPLYGEPHDAIMHEKGDHYIPGKKGIPYLSIIKEEAANQNVDVNIVLAIIDVESDFQANLVGKYARGLMQLTPETARWLGMKNVEKSILDPRINVRFGIKELKVMWGLFSDADISDLSKYDLHTRDDVKLVLAAYNAGPGNVKKYKGVPPFKETRSYIVEVINEYYMYKEGK